MGSQLQAYSKVTHPQSLPDSQSSKNELTVITDTNPTPLPPAVPDGRRDPQGAARPAGGQVQLRDDGEGVSEACPGGEDRGGQEALRGGGEEPAASRAAAHQLLCVRAASSLY